MPRTTRPYESRLDQQLILRSVRNERDVDRFAGLNERINDPVQGATCTQLLRHHPSITYDDFLLIEDESTGEVVSTTCLIPWQCSFEGVTLNVAMLEMVVTDPAYRQRGLVRMQIERFHRAVAEQSFDFSMIEGIPYYYRQYGYTYATDHYGYDVLPIGQIPRQTPEQTPKIQVRPATVADVALLAQLYTESTRTLPLHILRDEAYWQFLLHVEHYPAHLIENANTGHTLGYVCSTPSRDGKTIRVFESIVPNAGVGLALLQQLVVDPVCEIQLWWPASSALTALGRTLGSVPHPEDQWLIRIPDLRLFLQKLGPVFAQRLSNAGWPTFSATLIVNLYRQAYQLTFAAGQLIDVAAIGFVDASMGADGGDLCIPPDAFVRLLFGYRTLDELRDAWPDIVEKPGSRAILANLFPKRTAFFLMPYIYRGAIPIPSGSS